jgi:hypothetical protein
MILANVILVDMDLNVSFGNVLVFFKFLKKVIIIQTQQCAVEKEPV